MYVQTDTLEDDILSEKEKDEEEEEEHPDLLACRPCDSYSLIRGF
jgi:hypothetical protein